MKRTSMGCSWSEFQNSKGLTLDKLALKSARS